MAEIVNMHQAKTSLSRLVERALAGEEVVIARNGEPLMKLVPVPKDRLVAASQRDRHAVGAAQLDELRDARAKSA
jgi:prevent-host-death family protein